MAKLLFASNLLSLGFIATKSYILYCCCSPIIGVLMWSCLLLYVDDIVLTALSPGGLLQRNIATLQQVFSMTDMGQLHHFLGVFVTCRDDGLFHS